MFSSNINRAVQILKRGGLVAFPTETVYGLGASIGNPEAIAKIFQIKRRPADNPLIVHISRLEELEGIAMDVPKELVLLANHFWPGPLTVVLRRHPHVPNIVSAGLETVAVRMPAHPIAKALIVGAGPLVAPSANLSGRPSATTAGHVREDFGDSLGMIVDGGATSLGIESSVIMLEPYVYLRPGLITKEAIEKVLGKKMREKVASDNAVSPGMRHRHYAPKTKLKLVFFPQSGAIVVTAENLYEHFRRADREKIEELVIYVDAATLQNPALMDRITRAAAN